MRESRLVPRKGNFGDLLGPWIVARMVEQLGLDPAKARDGRLLAVGSIMRMAREGDTIWGAGINGKSLDGAPFPALDVRAVRGPLTAERLRAVGNYVPDVYGDPALLIPHLWSDAELGIARRTGGLLLMPNLFDTNEWPPTAMSPRGSFKQRVRAIASADLVVASSLHAIVIAEAYGVPAVLVKGAEAKFKYEDYFEGTGRSMPKMADGWKAGLEAEPLPPLAAWDATATLRAFPIDLWK